MGIESRNHCLNQFHFKIGQQGLTLAIINGDIFQLNANWLAYKYWMKQTRLNKYERQQPQYIPFPLLKENKQIFEKLGQAFTTLFNLQLSQYYFKSKNKKYHLMNIIQVDENAIKEFTYSKMLQSGIHWKGDNRWSNIHNIQLWIHLYKNKLSTINQSELNKIVDIFNKKFNEKFIWEKCKRCGSRWTD